MGEVGSSGAEELGRTRRHPPTAATPLSLPSCRSGGGAAGGGAAAGAAASGERRRIPFGESSVDERRSTTPFASAACCARNSVDTAPSVSLRVAGFTTKPTGDCVSSMSEPEPVPERVRAVGGGSRIVSPKFGKREKARRGQPTQGLRAPLQIATNKNLRSVRLDRAARALRFYLLRYATPASAALSFFASSPADDAGGSSRGGGLGHEARLVGGAGERGGLAAEGGARRRAEEAEEEGAPLRRHQIAGPLGEPPAVRVAERGVGPLGRAEDEDHSPAAGETDE